MRLFEFQKQRLLLCTHVAQKVGDVVSMDEPCDWLGPDLEATIEARRPEGSLARAQSLILTRSPIKADYTYVVDPIGKLERQNEGWLNRLRAADPLQSGVLAHYADGYWSGQICPEERGAAWQYRASAVRIVDRIGGSAKG